MLQCKAGYRECAGKRIEIAEHLRYLPMGYFNENSLGEITTITTNIMEQLGDVATRVVMLTTQGILNTAIIVLLILVFDWRIGLICIVGIVVFAFINRASDRVGDDDDVVAPDRPEPAGQGGEQLGGADGRVRFGGAVGRVRLDRRRIEVGQGLAGSLDRKSVV